MKIDNSSSQSRFHVLKSKKKLKIGNMFKNKRSILIARERKKLT